jgi:Flp pilus assembly protein TadG
VERGSATVEFTFAVPLLFFLVVVIVQFGIWAHGSAVVRAAAQEAVRTARVESGSTEAGVARAQDFLSRVGGSLEASSSSPRIMVERDRDRAAATVDAAVVSLLPGVELRVHGEAAGAVERYRRAEERR